MSQMEKMASNTQRGQMRPNHGSRSPPFVIVGLLVVIAILAFNYWSVSSTNRELNDQLSSLGSKYRQNDAVLKKRETSLSDELRLMAKQKEEVKTKLGNLENVLRGKEEEISSLKSTVGTKESEVDGLKTDLENQKTQCDENMKKLDNCNSSLTNCNQVLDSGRKESTQKGEELQSCQQREQSLQQELNNLKNSPQQNTQSCTNEVNTMRITLLTKLQQIGGNQVIELLSKAGVDTSGVAIIKSGEQNIQTGDQQNSQQQQGNQVINQNQLQGNQNRPVAGGNVGQKSPSEQGGQSPQNQLHTTTTTATTKTTSIGVESQQDLHGQQGSLGIKKSNESNLNQSVMQQAAPVKQNQSDFQPAMQQQPPLLQNNSSGNGQLQQKNASSPVQKKNSFEGHNQPVAQVGPPQIHQDDNNTEQRKSTTNGTQGKVDSQIMKNKTENSQIVKNKTDSSQSMENKTENSKNKKSITESNQNMKNITDINQNLKNKTESDQKFNSTLSVNKIEVQGESGNQSHKANENGTQQLPSYFLKQISNKQGVVNISQTMMKNSSSFDQKKNKTHKKKEEGVKQEEYNKYSSVSNTGLVQKKLDMEQAQQLTQGQLNHGSDTNQDSTKKLDNMLLKKLNKGEFYDGSERNKRLKKNPDNEQSKKTAAGEGEGKDKQGEQDDKQDEDMEEDQALKFKGDGAQDIQEEEDYLDKGFN